MAHLKVHRTWSATSAKTRMACSAQWVRRTGAAVIRSGIGGLSFGPANAPTVNGGSETGEC